MMMRRRNVGWRGESHRHYLAAKGISTSVRSRGYFAYTVGYRLRPRTERALEMGVLRKRIQDSEAELKVVEKELSDAEKKLKEAKSKGAEEKFNE